MQGMHLALQAYLLLNDDSAT